MRIRKSLSPNPSPNGEGSENHCLQIRESLSPIPSPNGEGSENYCLQIRESLSPNPSPNGEGSENLCLQTKGASRWCKERLSSIRRNALLKWRRAFPYSCSFVITIRVTILLCLNNMSLKQYVAMSFCLKKHILLS